MRRVKSSLRHLYQVTSMPEMAILPGQIAFFLVLSLIPIISLVGIAGGFFSLSVDTLANVIQNNFPTDISQIVMPLITGRGLDINMIIFLVFSFIIASNGAYSIIVASNMIYGKNADNSVLKRRIKSVMLTIIIVLLFIFVIIVPTFGTRILQFIGDTKFISPVIFKQFNNLFEILKWPTTLLTFFITFKLIYTIAPDKAVASKYVNRGALFTSIGWILTTIVYSYYISHFSYYDLFYGALSNIIILMFWIYLLSFIFVFGICLNSNFYYSKKNEYIQKEEKK